MQLVSKVERERHSSIHSFRPGYCVMLKGYIEIAGRFACYLGKSPTESLGSLPHYRRLQIFPVVFILMVSREHGVCVRAKLCLCVQSEGLGPAQPARVPVPSTSCRPCCVLELELLDPLNSDVKDKSSWVLCQLWMLCYLPRLWIAVWRWGSLGGGRAVRVLCLGLFASESGRNGEECGRSGAWASGALLTDSSIPANPVN